MRLLTITFLLLALLAAPAAASELGAAQYLKRHRGDHVQRHAFLYDMPKGGDVHNHLSGAVYAESMVRRGAAGGVCVDVITLFSKAGPCTAGQRPLTDAFGDNIFYNEILRAWSMKGFRDGGRSGHDHFFATFDRFSAANGGQTGDMLAEVSSRAAAQNEQYLETLITPRFGDVSALARRVEFDPADLAGSRRRLLDAGLRDIVPRAAADLTAALARQRALLQCATPAADAACDMPVRFHVGSAVRIAGAERIGHGVDIRGERNPAGLMRIMARRGIAVEVPLTSNCQVLEVCGRAHPIRLYVRSGVPVVLATDDEGVSRSDLTAQYELAVVEQGFGYRTLKRFARNALRYSFLAPADKAAALRAQRAAFRRFEARFPAKTG
ncbi:amidohydrolase family protein [Capillimicrobium parvum]|uniref:adenosine deaminase n=1 Tax=Capillimicrobium parvum TaxID=2884022 RepID=A0A9E6XS43_9ACTN|nr:hypothetical protein [Capillimicrobium parvum]UGS33789.1 Adenosine deaminase [Capillimicrobium parvum]